MHERRLEAVAESWPIAGSFVIARGAKTEAVVVVATVRQGDLAGRGEAVPYARYGETVEDVVADIRRMAGAIAGGLDRAGLRAEMKPGAARNAVDCALLDLEAKAGGLSAASLLGLPEPVAVETAFTLSLGTPEAMAAAARAAAGRPVIKIKLGGDGDPERIGAVRAALPDARLILDANEAWSEANWRANVGAAVAAGAALIEQPFPAGRDEALAWLERPIPVCADESAHVAADIAGLAGRYDAVNIKLDKAGGLTEAVDMARAARAAGLGVMVGCMVATSLAMAPAMLLAGGAEFVDLDGPLLLARDRTPGLRYDGSRVQPPSPALWG